MTHEDLLLVAFVLSTIIALLSARRFVRSFSESSRPPRKRDLAVGNLLVLLTILAAGLTIGELYYRFVYDTTESFGLTKVTTAWFERHYQLNAQGVRDSVDYSDRRIGDESGSARRITFLGDSFLAGHGVADVEDRFANRIRRARPKWDVQVLAHLGADTQREIDVLEGWIADGYALDELVLVYCLNDIQSVAPESKAHDERIKAYRSARPLYPFRHSFLLNKLYFAWLARHDDALSGYFDFLGRAYENPTWAKQALRLDALRRVAESAGAELRVVTFPFLHALGPDYAFGPAHARLDEYWRARAVPHLDLLDLFEDSTPSAVVVHASDAHPNERAHALAAEAILGFLDAQPSARSGRREGESATATPQLRWEAVDQGVVLRHGDATGHCRYLDGEVARGDCDALGARDVWLFEHEGLYLVHYDAAGARGWLASRASSRDLEHWRKHGPILSLGPEGASDSAGADYGIPFFDGDRWHLFYLGTPNASPPPGRIPALPYSTLKATAEQPTGPWRKQYDVVPFRPTPGTFYSDTASPGPIVEREDGYLQIFSAASERGGEIFRTLGLARTQNLDGAWTIDREPLLPATEQIENASLYFEDATRTWFLFTNRVHVSGRYTDAIVVYWSSDLEHWSVNRKAVVLDGANSIWSHAAIGLPSVLPVADRLAILYDGLEGNGTSHLERDIGLAWLPRPLVPKWTRIDPLRWEMDSRDEIEDPQQLALRFDAGRVYAEVKAPYDDPYFALVGSAVSASQYDRLRFRARLTGLSGRPGSIYFFHPTGFDIVRYAVTEGWHTYSIDLSSSPAWAGQIDRIRMDFVGDGDSRYEIEVDWIELGTVRGSR